jgi:predicted AlkP superfamily pyrophosphatase or phosphodiesterase
MFKLKKLKSLVVLSLFFGPMLITAGPGLAADAPAGKAPPKLVVFMVVDGFPQEQVTKYYDQLSDGGLKRLIDKGAWYSDNHYSHATTYTSVGHATLLSCAHPYKHGLVGNDWLDKKTKERVYSTEDPNHKYIDETTSKQFLP